DSLLLSEDYVTESFARLLCCAVRYDVFFLCRPGCALGFCLLCCGAPREQHSFPTRRSSDLVAGAEQHGACDVEPARRPDRGLGQDRKSTRLNSSHVKISYAVFCLKKKNFCPIWAQCGRSLP